jgi:hypothetical protein
MRMIGISRLIPVALIAILGPVDCRSQPPLGDVMQSGVSTSGDVMQSGGCQGVDNDQRHYIKNGTFDRCAWDRAHYVCNPLTPQYGMPDHVPIDREIMEHYLKCAVDACAVGTRAVCWGKQASGPTFNISCQWDRTSLICQGLPQDCRNLGTEVKCDATNATANTGPAPTKVPIKATPYIPFVPNVPAPPVQQPSPATPAQPIQTPPRKQYTPAWIKDDGTNSTYRFANGYEYEFPNAHLGYTLDKNSRPELSRISGTLIRMLAHYRDSRGNQTTFAGNQTKPPLPPLPEMK